MERQADAGALPAYGQKTATGSQDQSYNRIAGRGTPLRSEPAQGTSEAGKGKVFAATRSRCGGLAVLVALLCACATAPAWAAVPSGYSAQALDPPGPAEGTLNGARAGAGVVNAGDVELGPRG